MSWRPTRSWPLALLDRLLQPTDVAAYVEAELARPTPSSADPFGLDLIGARAALSADLTDETLPRFSPLGTWLARAALEHGAKLRKDLVAHWARASEDLDDVIPVVIVGLHRTGTTYLQTLLGSLPDWRTPTFAELYDPLGAGSRAAAGVALLAGRLVSPEMKLVHPVALDAPEECWMLLLATMAARNWDLHLRLPRYRAWLDAADLRPAYRFHARSLATLVARWSPRPRVLVLKCPEHLWALDALVEAFPRAVFVWPHRDPARSVAAYASLSALQHRAIYGRFDAHEVGAHIADRFAAAIARALATRDRLGATARFVDTGFEEIAGDTPTAVLRIARAVEGAIDPARKAAMRERVQRTGKAYGSSAHKVLPRDFGLDEAALTRSFAAYHERFGAITKR